MGGVLEEDGADHLAQVRRDVALAAGDAAARDLLGLERGQGLEAAIGVLLVGAVQERGEVGQGVVGLEWPDADGVLESLGGRAEAGRWIIAG